MNLARNSTSRNACFLGNLIFKRAFNESTLNSFCSLNRDCLLKTYVITSPFLQIVKNFSSAISNQSNKSIENLISHYSSECIDKNELESTVSFQKRCAHFKGLLQEIFCLDNQEYEDLIRRYPLIWKKYSYYSLKHLHDIGLQKSTLIDYPWLVSKDSGDTSQRFKYVIQYFNNDFLFHFCS